MSWCRLCCCFQLFSPQNVDVSVVYTVNGFWTRNLHCPRQLHSLWWNDSKLIAHSFRRRLPFLLPSADFASSVEFLTEIEPINNTNNYTLSGKEFMILIIVLNLQVLEPKLLHALQEKKSIQIIHNTVKRHLHGPAEEVYKGMSCSPSTAPPAWRMHVPIRPTAGNKLRLWQCRVTAAVQRI